MHPQIKKITEAIEARSARSRDEYLSDLDSMASNSVTRETLSCGNLAHGFAACSQQDKSTIKLMEAANVGIVTAYNDMLSAQQPYAGTLKNSSKRW